MASPIARLRRALSVVTPRPDTRDEARFHEALGVLGDLSARGRAATDAARAQPRAEVRVPLVFVDDELPPPRDALAAAAPRPRLAVQQRRHRVRVGAVVAAAALLATGAVIAGLAGTAHPTPTASRRPGASTSRTTASSTTSSTTTTSTTTTTTTPALGLGTPTLTALSPSSGAPGSEVTITGSDLAAANGSIVATFDGRTTPTACPSEQRCTATVPTGLHGRVSVVLQVGSRATNALIFTVQ